MSSRAHASNGYVSADHTGASPLIAGATSITSAEKFGLTFG